MPDFHISVDDIDDTDRTLFHLVTPVDPPTVFPPERGALKYLSANSLMHYGNGTQWIPLIGASTVTIANEGVGTGLVYDNLVGGVSNLRSLLADTASGKGGIEITTVGTEIVVGNTVNGTNLGPTGSSVFSSKVGSNLEFRKIIGSSGIAVTQNTNDITIGYAGPSVSPLTSWTITDQKPTGTHGGASLAGVNTRVLNTITAVGPNPANVTLAANLITIQPGIYLVNASAPAHQNSGHRISLVNNATSAVVLMGTNAAAHSSGTTTATMNGSFQVAATITCRLEHYMLDAKATDGLGEPIGQVGQPEVYATIVFTQIG